MERGEAHPQLCLSTGLSEAHSRVQCGKVCIAIAYSSDRLLLNTPQSSVHSTMGCSARKSLSKWCSVKQLKVCSVGWLFPFEGGGEEELKGGRVQTALFS